MNKKKEKYIPLEEFMIRVIKSLLDKHLQKRGMLPSTEITTTFYFSKRKVNQQEFRTI